VDYHQLSGSRRKDGEVPLSPDPRPRSSRVGINPARSAGSGFVEYLRFETVLGPPSPGSRRRTALPVDIHIIVVDDKPLEHLSLMYCMYSNIYR
jgi:hypothetical protein